MKLSVLTLAISSILTQSALAAEPMPSQAEMWRLIQQQQQQIKLLTESIQESDEKVEAAIVAVEEATQVSSSSQTHIGGYGELHYNNLSGKGGAADKDEIDFHRFVLFFGHEFNNKLRFFSELEIEHSIAGEGKVGEVELEQAYIEMDLDNQTTAKAGMFLLPIGIINETHEPPTFYGVERNPVEKNIIPATWWAAGVSLSGELSEGWHYDIAFHEGLKTSAADSYKPRKGRQKTGKASAKDLALTSRLKWTGMQGVEVGLSWNHQANITQSEDPTAGRADLFEAHVSYNNGPFGLKALAAFWDLDGAGPKSIGANRQEGWYVEPSYKINDQIGVFARYNQYDNAAGSSSDSEKVQIDLGVNYWLSPDVVLKADYQIQDNENKKDQDGFNLSVGYQF